MATGSLCFSFFFLRFFLSGGWLREMVTGSLCFPFFLIFLLAGDGYGKYGYGKVLGDGYGRWLREVFVFPLFLDISPFRGMVTEDGYRRWLRGVFVFFFFLIFLLLVKIHLR